MFKLDNKIEGIGQLNFFENLSFIKLYELDDNTKGIGELDFFDNPGFAKLF